MLQHPAAPVAHVGGQGVAAVGFDQIAVGEPALRGVRERPGSMYSGVETAVGLAVLLGVLQCTFENQDGHWVQVAGLHLAAQTQALEGDGPAAGEGVEQLGRLARRCSGGCVGGRAPIVPTLSGRCRRPSSAAPPFRDGARRPSLRGRRLPSAAPRARRSLSGSSTSEA